jgi:hypothetical protein
MLAKRECDHGDVKWYATQIRSPQRDLGLSVNEFTPEEIIDRH